MVDANVSFEEEDLEEIRKSFKKFDLDDNGFITAKEIGSAMKELGEDIPGFRIRIIIEEADKDENGKIDFDEFLRIYKTHSKKSVGSEFMQLIGKREQLEILRGTSESSAEGTKHSYSEGELVAFVDWIKTSLKDDEEFKAYLPINSKGQEIFTKLKDGIILCKMINVAVSETVDERAITKTKSQTAFLENLTLALNSARSIGCSIVNIGAEDLKKGTEHLVLGFLWQIIRLGLFAKITLSNVPELVALLSHDESLNDMMALPPEDILLRWFNYQLERTDCKSRVENFSEDIKDSECYFHLLKVLLKSINPDAVVDSSARQEKDPIKKAAKTLMMADSIGCKKFVRPKDVVAGDPKLNMAFVANLFNHHHCLPPLDSTDEDPKEETREERTFRNWMNSIGVSPYVNYLYTDLRNGRVLLDVFNIIEPGIVKTEKVYRPPSDKKIVSIPKQLENCNYAVEIGKGKEMNFSLVGIGGQDIFYGNKTLTLAIVWQQMRAYTLALLSKLTPDGTKIEDKDIIKWVNYKLQEAGKSSRITNFQDISISSSLPVLDLVDAIKPGTVKYDMVSKGSSEKDKHRNAKYALSVARKIGAATYALPDDLVEVKPKMVLTVFACLMAANLVIEKKIKKNRKY